MPKPSSSAMSSSSALENVDPNVMAVEASTLPTKSAKKVPRSRRTQQSGDEVTIPESVLEMQQKSDVGDGYKINKRTGSKRKRNCITASVIGAEEKGSLINQFQSEINSLVYFFREDEGNVQSNTESRPTNTSPVLKQRAEIASLVEGSSLPFSKLVSEIYGKLNASVTDSESSFPMTLCTLRGSILSIGERIMFGILNPDADVLEDDSERCLWCWEVYHSTTTCVILLSLVWSYIYHLTSQETLLHLSFILPYSLYLYDLVSRLINCCSFRLSNDRSHWFL